MFEGGVWCAGVQRGGGQILFIHEKIERTSFGSFAYRQALKARLFLIRSRSFASMFHFFLHIAKSYALLRSLNLFTRYKIKKKYEVTLYHQNMQK